MGRSVQDISRVQISYDGDAYVCEAFTEEAFMGGEILVVLSNTRDTNNESARLAVSKEWHGQDGVVRCEEKLLASVTYLYLYLVDAQKIASNVVRVFIHTPYLSGYQLAEKGLVYLALDTKTSDYSLAQQLAVGNGGAKIFLDLPACGVRLPELGIWGNADCACLSLSYQSRIDGVNICGPEISGVLVRLRGPEVIRLEISENVLVGQGDFEKETAIWAEIRRGMAVAASARLTAEECKSVLTFRWDLSGEGLDPSQAYTLRLCYLTGEKGESLSAHGPEYPLLLGTPKVQSVRASGEETVVCLGGEAQYEVTEVTAQAAAAAARRTGQARLVSGSEIRFPAEITEIDVRMCQGISYGPSIYVKTDLPRFLSIKQGNETFYSLCHGLTALPKETVTVPLGRRLDGYEKGEGFRITSREQESALEIEPILAERLVSGSNSVYDEFEEMLACCAKDYETMEMLARAVLEHAPLRAEDILAFRYRYRVSEARVDLLSGLALSIEYAVYQNIPENQRMLLEDGRPAGISDRSGCPEAYDGARGDYQAVGIPGMSERTQDVSRKNGYVGTGACEYQVVLRNGRVVLEPFIQGFTQAASYVIPASGPLDSQAQLDGGAGVADFLADGMAAPFVRLLYPIERTGRNSKGEMRYFHNICLAAGQSLSALIQASQAMRRQELPKRLAEVSLADLRGRATIRVRLMVTVNKVLQWVSMGTTAGDMADALGIPEGRLALWRQTSFGPCPVFADELGSMRLVSGDILEVSQGEAWMG